MQNRLDPQPLFDWMNERHAIWCRRQDGRSWPWTDDPILQEHAFCNVFRELDRVTIWIDQHIRQPYADHKNLWFMLAIARTINWPPTLQSLMDDPQAWPHGDSWSWRRAAKILDWRKAIGAKVYTGAYMIRAENDRSRPWGRWTKQEYICGVVLGALWEARTHLENWVDVVPLEGVAGGALEDFHTALCRFHGWGPFMAYEVVTDLRHTRYLKDAADIMTWAAAGPGAIRGLCRLTGRPVDRNGYTQAEALTMMRMLCELANNCSPLGVSLFTRKHPDGKPHEFEPIEMRDIEHSLCELDKYLRCAEGGHTRSKYHPGASHAY